MKLREGYKRIAIRCAERGVYGEYFVRTPESMESARKVVGVLFFFMAFARTEMKVLR